MSSVGKAGPNVAVLAHRPTPKSKSKVATQSPNVQNPDQVQLSGTKETVSAAVRRAISNLVPIAVTLEVPTAAVGGIFKSIPVFLTKEQSKDPSWTPEAGSSISTAPVLDAHISLDAPKGQRPAAVRVDSLTREEMPEGRQHFPVQMSDNGKVRLERDWSQGIRESILDGKVTNERAFVTLTMAVDQESLQELGNHDIVFAPHSKIDPSNMTWKNSNDAFIKSKFTSGHLLDEDDDHNSVPVVEYLLVDEQFAETNLPEALHQAKEGRAAKETSLSSDWQGQKVPFKVQTTERFEKAMASSPNLSFHAEQATILKKNADGTETRMPLSLAAQAGEEAAELPTWLMKPEGFKSVGLPKNRVVVDVDPQTRVPIATCPDGLVFAGAVNPEPNKQYSTKVMTPNGPHEVKVAFQERAAQLLNISGVTFSVDHAVLYAADGQKVPLDSRKHEEQDPNNLLLRAALGLRPVLTEHDAPWTTEFYKTSTQAIYGLPKHGVEIQTGENGAPKAIRLGSDGKPMTRDNVDDSLGLESGYKTLRANRDKTMQQILGTERGFQGNNDYVPVTETKVNDRLLVRAPNEKLAKQAERLSKLFLGADQNTEIVELADFQKFRDEGPGSKLEGENFQEMVNSAVAASRSLEERERMANFLGLEWDSQPMEEMTATLERRLLRGAPIEVTVVPSGADITHYLNDNEKKAMNSARIETAAFVLAPNIATSTGGDTIPPTRIFVGEELFETPKKRSLVAHELLHVYMDIYAGAEEDATVQKAYSQSVAGEREFPSLYGALEDEFVPTIGEEFMGLHGNDGPAWVKKEHPEMYAMLQKLTGSDPVNGKPVKL